MKVIGFITSPRKEGNTAWIVNKILEGAKEQGAETQSWYFSDLDIKPCRGCWGCHKGDQGCVIKDDMQKLNQAIDHANAIVFGSPIYMMQMTAQAKIFIDRMFARFSPRYSPYFKEENAAQKKLILTFNQGNPDSSLFQSYIDYTKHMFELLEFDVKEVPVVTGMRNGPAYERKDLHTVLKDIGSSLISERLPK
ncbi:flavodoxin family protein [Desulfosporosinus sp. FKB]|uniref:flavodoxin family protein n=1 Tax=Desulfosporosinus sp. FKB TaxID=1969835 RepID=UPI000B49C0BC|nr:flavodoxin family protein [Desulfosporosinus sp. FKB]